MDLCYLYEFAEMMKRTSHLDQLSVEGDPIIHSIFEVAHLFSHNVFYATRV